MNEVPQPNNPFSADEYLDFLKAHQEISDRKKQYSSHSELFALSDQLRVLEYQYLDRLPVYVLARCPYCDGKVWEGIDTLSLNGPGWRHKGWRGRGWYGNRPKNPDDKYSKSRPIAHISCDHFYCLDFCINLNGEIPSEVHSFEQHADMPSILKLPMEYPGTKVVMCALPIQRVDAGQVARPFTVYFTTYFVTGPEIADNILDRWVSDEPEPAPDNLMLMGGRDYNLNNWLPTGNLYWLTGDENEPELKNAPPDEFPYGNIQGKPPNFYGPPMKFWIEDGKIERYEPFWKRLLGWLWPES